MHPSNITQSIKVVTDNWDSRGHDCLVERDEETAASDAKVEYQARSNSDEEKSRT